MNGETRTTPGGCARVSVALGTHNGTRFVGEQIASILAQTLPVDEIVLSDDASTDRTVEMVEEAVAAHRATHGSAPALIVLRNDPALRVTKNFEQALTHCTGNLIALCDQDDVWHPERTEKLVGCFEDPTVQLVFSNARQVDAAGNYLGHDLFEALAMNRGERELVESGQAYRQFMRRNLATGATMMLRRSLIDLAAPFPDSWLHDEWLALVAAASNGVRMVDETFTDYRQHGGNQVGMSPVRTRRKFSMFMQPRTERNRRLYLRAVALDERIAEIPVSSETYRHMAHEKAAFEAARQAYPEARLLRLLPVIKQVFKGNYRRYGTGLRDAVRNLLQPV